VYTWTLNDAPDVAGAALLAVDGVITDDPAATIKLLNSLVGAMPASPSATGK
jgi:glycerophosphoryl diester phosphodiesterase